ncbi:Heat shock cognate protein 1 [Carex littledalei]|uniref:Heat shock cognate protein 1 n=1 Tax=Carex littledalei TaxID=544730 RepID=A0A833VI92_9POAL|nr:Heat shock cognate protein 1 [Carex littledalei]
MIEAAACYKAQDEEHKARAAALNSLENFAYKMKAIVRDPFSSVSAFGKKLVEENADEVIAWLDTNHHAGIDEINARKKYLEIIQREVTPIV